MCSQVEEKLVGYNFTWPVSYWFLLTGFYQILASSWDKNSDRCLVAWQGVENGAECGDVWAEIYGNYFSLATTLKQLSPTLTASLVSWCWLLTTKFWKLDFNCCSLIFTGLNYGSSIFNKYFWLFTLWDKDLALK